MLLQAAQTSWFAGATTAAFVLHIAGGTVGLVSGTLALFARKGGRVHRAAGTVFFISMLVMAAFAAYLGAVIPGQIANFFGGIFAFYLVATGWLTIHRPAGLIGVAEKIALAAVACLCVPNALLLLQVTTGLSLPGSAPPPRGPVLVASSIFACVIFLAALADARMVLAGGISGAARIARHLWRMCLGLTIAAGSAFTNGLPRLLPGPMHVTGIYFLPLFVPLVLMAFWLLRVRLTGWYAHRSRPQIPAAAV